MSESQRDCFVPCVRAIVFATLLAGLGACDQLDLPLDPDGTLDRVLETGRMRVAAVDHRPWVIVHDESGPTGAEVELVESFARGLGVSVEWTRAPAFEALEALESGGVDLAIGGFARPAVTARAGASPTYAYFRDALVVAAAPGEPVPDSLDGQRVFVPPESLAEGYVRAEGGIPVGDPGDDVRLRVLPSWQLPASGLVPTGMVLRRYPRVMAVSAGENAWIMRLETFLRRHDTDLGARLRAFAE